MTDVAFDATGTDLVAAPVAPKKSKKKVAATRAKKVADTTKSAGAKEHKGSRARRRKVMGFALLGIISGEGILTALSLSHLALGISIVTGHSSANWQDWAFALTFDAVMVACKIAMLFTKETEANNDVHKYGAWFVTGCLIVSACINSMAFAQEARGLMIYPAILFGILIPAGIFLLTKIAAALYMDYSRG